MKVLLLIDNGIEFSKAEIEFGMTRYAVWDSEGVIDCDNNLEALAKRHNLKPRKVKRLKPCIANRAANSFNKNKLKSS